MKNDEEETTRPKVAAEVRAWVLVGIVLLTQMTGGVWYAATLNAEVKSLRDLINDLRVQIQSTYAAADASRDRDRAELRSIINDHEGRLRSVEARRQDHEPRLRALEGRR